MLAHSRTRRPGQLSLISLFAVFTLMLLMAGLLNVSRVTATKMDQQNAADAAAHAAGVEMARGMNTLVTLNHLMAELNALDALVMSFGGLELEDYLKDGRKRVRMPYAGVIKKAYLEAVVWQGPAEPAARKAAFVEPRTKSGGAIGDARKKLLPILLDAYRLHKAGGILCTDPVLKKTFGVLGQAMVLAAAAIEQTVQMEWEVLEKLEQMAEEQLLPLKWLCNHGVPKQWDADGIPIPDDDWGIIPRLNIYALQTVKRTPHRAEAAAAAVAEEHGATGSLFPNTTPGGKFELELPVEKEEIHRESEDHKKSQMVRGMTPWVQYWRWPVLRFGRQVLRLSEFAPAYHKHSQKFTLNMAWWQWVENETKLYRLKDLEVSGDDKGREKWTTADGSGRANELFGVLGFAHCPPPDVFGMPIFRQPQPDGMAAHAQVLLYNANPQDRPRKHLWQPVVGWDTLGWTTDVPEFEYGEDYRKATRTRIDQPRMKVNWQTKLVPVAAERLTNAVGTQRPELNRILGRLTTDRPLVNTH